MDMGEDDMDMGGEKVFGLRSMVLECVGGPEKCTGAASSVACTLRL